MSAQKEKPRPHTPQAPPHAKGSSRGLPRHHHVETHFEGSETVRDVVLGMSDGLTVPFALAAGLSGAVASSRVVLVAGVAELAAGAIAMGLGGYLAAKSEADTWHSELRREHEEVVEVPAEEKEEVRKVFMGWGLEGNVLESATEAVCSDRDRWVDFMMREELHLSEPDPKRARVSALTIGGSYVAGGAIPLGPYLFPVPITTALLASVVVTLIALGVFGAFKGRLTGRPAAAEALRTVLVGALASGAAYALARLISG
ncbi:MAG TPA: VIT1/CCC1 transporter family protein [Thermoanaerobaculia bacterium]|nr:VIT1/CCC1 transporter family protein [Thermoanaerobaculia bacterium]